MAQAGPDRRPGMEMPVIKPMRTRRFAHLAAAKPTGKSTASPAPLAAFVAVAFLGACDGCFFDGYYACEMWRLIQQIAGAFRF